jgi:group I intron endonuclease
MIVYLLTNVVNRKVYVGQHCGFDLSKRWNDAALNCCKATTHLGRAVRKYGADAFHREVITYASCQQELDLLERFHILIRQSTNPQFGYNEQAGGIMWRGFHTPEIKQKIAQSLRQMWQGKSRVERKRHAAIARIQWQDPVRKERMRRRVSRSLQFVWDHRTEEEKQHVLKNLEQGRNGHVAWSKGKRLGPYSAVHKNNISVGLRRHWAQKKLKALPPKKPVVSSTANTPTRQLQLVEAKQNDARQNAAQAALKVLAEMRRQLRHIEKTLNELNTEVRGSCLW